MIGGEDIVHRLNPNERKKEILNAALKVFLEKGFSNATMEDIISKTTLSKGGVYHHYANIYEIIVDIFLKGNKYRINIMKKYVKEHNLSIKDLKNPDIVAELLTAKVTDTSEYMSIYAMFLTEIKFNRKLKEVFYEIVDKSKQELFDFTNLEIFIEDNNENFIFLTNIINTFILGANLLEINDDFYKNREVIKQMIKTVLVLLEK